MPTAPSRKYGFIDKTLNACGKFNDFLGKVKGVNGITDIRETSAVTGESTSTNLVDYGLNHGVNRLVDFSQKHDVIGKIRSFFKI